LPETLGHEARRYAAH